MLIPRWKDLSDASLDANPLVVISTSEERLSPGIKDLVGISETTQGAHGGGISEDAYLHAYPQVERCPSGALRDAYPRGGKMPIRCLSDCL